MDNPVEVEPAESARTAGLRHVSDDEAGIRRLRRGRDGFRYLDARGRAVQDRATLGRIRSLAIPPAWERVWICADEGGHIQATGRDARGRKQYRYHPRWRAVRDSNKYDRMIAFAQALPLVRERCERALALPGLPREKVLATVVRLLEATLIRVGNDEYARANRSFGLTTLLARHVDVDGSRLRFEFRGKSGKQHVVDVTDRRLARIVERCRELPGQTLFQYVGDDGERRAVGSADVNEYLRDVTGDHFTAKDFRTWAGTVLAANALSALDEEVRSMAQSKRNVVQAIEEVAERLGNTKAVCRKSYVHPTVIGAYLDGTLRDQLTRKIDRKVVHGLFALSPEEKAVLAFLRARLRQDNEAAAEQARLGFGEAVAAAF